MNDALLAVIVIVPLLAAALLAVIHTPVAIRRTLLLGTNAFALAFGVWLVTATWGGTVLAHNVALWPAGISIPFVADMFSALMIVVTALLGLVCSAFGIAAGDDNRVYFAPLVLVLSGGVYGALLTGDLFNLFVFIEVMLLPSYGLIAMLGGARRIAGGRLYVAMNLMTSTIFLVGVGLVYGIAGTVNLAELAGAGKEDPLIGAALGAVLIALSVKAAVVPVHGWLTRTYPYTSPAVTALFSGLHTKVAIYAIYRIYAVAFDGDSRYLWIGVVLMSATMLIGVLGAVGENTTRAILTFHMVSQIGYILLGVALFGPIGLMAGIFYLLHHMIVKASLFLSTGAIEVTYKTNDLGKLQGIARTEPLIAAAFLGAAFSLAGLPPFSGFVAKLVLVRAAIDEAQMVAAIIAIAVSLLTLMSMMKIWKGMFWGRAAEDGVHAISARKPGRLLTHVKPSLAMPAVILTMVTLGVGIGAQGLLVLSEQAAAGLLDVSGYVEAVMGS
ncbi:monovalent cation/H+ antiporter subunit D family protein [Hoyosella rhizosphaerae]|uniref:Cation:proton antiporter n=1 Tax=Hoyosella rhizosphaerae TaxID=1755582 RepID=A0A916XIF4_9ACTN|nr:monovalent cation/H+ antiporter subunit D family protein [Hoyosella rhizosphaerae]MBN4925394.1 monovalent cation/H+ antiporter subunit D family protein [Hoyosella rhizosphaerae]GGC75556.1 cation:proton antiporter [Hoyosella rhizosphaerae]